MEPDEGYDEPYFTPTPTPLESSGLQRRSVFDDLEKEMKEHLADAK